MKKTNGKIGKKKTKKRKTGNLFMRTSYWCGGGERSAKERKERQQEAQKSIKPMKSTKK